MDTMNKFIVAIVFTTFITSIFTSCDNTSECCTQARSWFMGDSTLYPGVMQDTFVFQTGSDEISLGFRLNSLCLSDQLLFELYNDSDLVESLEVFDFQEVYTLETEDDIVYTLYTSVIPRVDPPGVCIRLGEIEVNMFY